MGTLERQEFGAGWQPDQDAVNAPPNALLRADNLILDIRGVPSLRGGSAVIGSAFADTDVHSLHTSYLSGTRYRMAGATDKVYANGAAITGALNGSGIIPFASFLGQIFFARGTSKSKYDGSTVRNWGITQSGGAPTVAAVAADGKTFATGALADAEFTYNERDATGDGYDNNHAGTANGARKLLPDATTNRGTMTKTFGGATDFTAYDSGGTGTDDDLIQFYVYVTEPADLLTISLMIDVNGGDFQEDYYIHDFVQGESEPLQPTGETPLPITTTAQGLTRRRVWGLIDPNVIAASVRARLRDDKPVAGVGWAKLSVRRGDMIRTGSTGGKDWKTVKALRLVVTTTVATALRFDTIRISANPMNGRYKWCYVLAYNTGTYVALSAPSALSAETQMQAQGATVTAPADASRDTQANEIWLYRMGGVMDLFYRVAVKTGVSGVTAVDISDALSDIDAMTLNIPLQTDNLPAPSSIIDIEGPYYDRLFALTSDGYMWPSRRLNPDSFSAGQAVRVTGVDETPYWIRKTISGLFVGTSKDIYRITGTGAELPDGTIDLDKQPVNIDHPPIMREALAQDGNLLVYLASDGWRAMSGAGSELLVGLTSLLYKGYTRHGVSPVNLTTGNLRATIGNHHLIALTPEGASTTSSTVLYRHAAEIGPGVWYRHVYPYNLRCVYTEPDGTVIASDTAGKVYTLDTGTTDASAAKIPITLWTKVDTDGASFARKDAGDLRIRADTGNVATSVAIHLDGSGAAALTPTLTQNGMGVSAYDLASLAPFTRVQLRVTVTTSAFAWYEHAIGYRDRPVAMIGRVPDTNAGFPGEKVISGLKLKFCSLGAARVITPYLDNVASGTTFTITTDTAEPETHILQFTSEQVATDIGWSSDGDVEVYEWEPLVDYQLPTRVKTWENRPLVPSPSRRRFTGLTLQIDTIGRPIAVTPVLDGVDQTLILLTTRNLLGESVTFPDVVGRDLWCRITEGFPTFSYTQSWELDYVGNADGINTGVANFTGAEDYGALDVTTQIGPASINNTFEADSLPLDPTALFRVHHVEPMMAETLPVVFQGRVPNTNAGYTGEKVISGFKIKLCTLGVARVITPYLDGVASSQTFTVTTAANEPATALLNFTSPQTAVDVAWSVDGDIELYETEPLVLYQLPPRLLTWENKPLQRSTVRRRLAGLSLQIHTHGATVTLTPVLDGVDQTALTINTADLLAKVVTFASLVGRDLWCRLTATVPFSVQAVEPIIVETLPQVLMGQTPRNRFGSDGVKTISGVQVRVCTFGVTRTFTLLVDGTQAGNFDVLSTVTEPIDFTFPLAEHVEGSEFALSLDGQVELYSWAPLITARRPLGVMYWDSGPIDLGDKEMVWLRRVFLKARASSPVDVLVYMDGRLVADQRGMSITPGTDTIIPIDFPKGIKGRQPRIVISSSGRFYPYWLKVQRRTSGLGNDKPTLTVPVQLETGGA